MDRERVGVERELFILSGFSSDLTFAFIHM
jgi:hypothetical protein